MRKITLTIILTLLLPIFGCGDDEPNKTGEACDEASDCEGMLCLETLGENTDDPIVFNDGYCSSSCSYEDTDGDGLTDTQVGCDTETEVTPETEVCLIYDEDRSDGVPGEGLCFVRGCETDWDCRDETYICYDFGFWEPLPVCIPRDVVD